MNTQPEALRLAALLEKAPAHTLENGTVTLYLGGTVVADKAATELRRLHAENEALRKTLAASCDEERQQMWEAGPGGGCSRALSAEFQRDALLEVVNKLEYSFDGYIKRYPEEAEVRAAIAKVEENT